MRKTMKRFLTAALSALAFVAIGFGVLALKAVDVAKAENVNLKIVGKTLNVSNNVNVVFFVPEEAGTKADITVHVTEKESTGDVESTLTADDTDYINEGKTYYRFVYRGVTAYEMENELIAYAELNGDVSPSVKYSILEYAYKKLGKADKEKDTTEGLEDLLKATLNYGSAAAKYKDKILPADFSYEDDYTYVSVANATFEDGFNYGVFKKGAELTITPDEGYTLAAGVENFTDNGDKTYTYTVPDAKPNLSEAFVDNSENAILASKIAAEKADLVYNLTAVGVDEFIEGLLAQGQTYPEIKITWSADNATIDGSKVIFDRAGDVALTATISSESGDVSDTKTFNIKVYPYKYDNLIYDFSLLPVGEQYKFDERVLDKYIKIQATDCHINTQLRIYSSTANNGYAIIEAADGSVIRTFEFNAGNKSDVLNVYGRANIDEEWTLIQGVSVASSYKDYTVEMGGKAYRYLKLDVEGSNQIRVASMKLSVLTNTELNAVPTEQEIVKEAADAFEFNVAEIQGNESITLPTETKENVVVDWTLAETTAATLNEDENLLTANNPDDDTQIMLTVTFYYGEKGSDVSVGIDYQITVKHVQQSGTGGEGGAEAFEITFNLGDNGSATHVDGGAATTYTETVEEYTLSITGGSKMYTGARDLMGNGCIKFGASSEVGKCSFTVPADVTEVVIYVAKYKANTTKVNINGTPYTLTKNSNDGAYDEIVVDTTTNKTVSFTTVSGGARAMLNTIVFKGTK